MSWWKKIKDKATSAAKSFASGLIKPIDDFLGTDFQSAWANEESKKAQEAQNAFNAQEAQKQRDWQTQMSNTAHQREVADLQKAGLNPVLSAGGGSGASTPSGGVATGQQRQVFTSAQRLAKAEIERINAETNNIKADTTQKNTNTSWVPKLNTAFIKQANANTAKAKTEAEKITAETIAQGFKNRMIEMDLTKRSANFNFEKQIYEAEMRKMARMAGLSNTDFNIAWNKAMEYINSFTKAWSPITGAFNSSETQYNQYGNSTKVNYYGN